MCHMMMEPNPQTRPNSSLGRVTQRGTYTLRSGLPPILMPMDKSSDAFQKQKALLSL